MSRFHITIAVAALAIHQGAAAPLLTIPTAFTLPNDIPTLTVPIEKRADPAVRDLPAPTVFAAKRAGHIVPDLTFNPVPKPSFTVFPHPPGGPKDEAVAARQLAEFENRLHAAA